MRWPRSHLRRAALPALLVFALMAGSGVSLAAPYANAQFHYRFEYPDGWSLDARDGIDMAIKGQAVGGFQPNVVAQHEDEPNATDSELWLQGYLQNSFLQLEARVNLTVIQAPRTFTTSSGRLAGDYVFEKQAQNITVRQRQVYFVSQYYHLAFFLTFTDKSSSFQGHAGDWQKASDSFAVEGEPSSVGLLSQPLVLAAIAGGGAAGAAVVLAHRRKSRAARGREPAPAQP